MVGVPVNKRKDLGSFWGGRVCILEWRGGILKEFQNSWHYFRGRHMKRIFNRIAVVRREIINSELEKP